MRMTHYVVHEYGECSHTFTMEAWKKPPIMCPKCQEIKEYRVANDKKEV